jgi:DNA-binding NarL/FixJ family response regulator
MKKKFFEKILLADDDMFMNTILRGSIFNASLAKHIVIADNRSEQADLLKNSPIDLLIVDMKNGGTKIIRLARKKQPEIKILCLSGSANNNPEEVVRNLGADLFLQKPAKREEIIGAIKKLL